MITAVILSILLAGADRPSHYRCVQTCISIRHACMERTRSTRACKDRYKDCIDVCRASRPPVSGSEPD